MFKLDYETQSFYSTCFLIPLHRAHTTRFAHILQMYNVLAKQIICHLHVQIKELMCILSGQYRATPPSVSGPGYILASACCQTTRETRLFSFIGGSDYISAITARLHISSDLALFVIASVMHQWQFYMPGLLRVGDRRK